MNHDMTTSGATCLALLLGISACLSGDCHVTLNPHFGEFTLQVTVYPGYVCYLSCGDAIDGLIQNANPDGDPETCEATLTLPRTENLIIPITTR